MRIIAISVFAVALAGCTKVEEDGTDEANADTETVADAGEERGDGEIQMAAGKWSQTMTIEKFELPGAPPEAAEMLQQMIGQQEATESCLTEDEVADGFEKQAKEQMDGDNCESKNFSAKGGKFAGTITCKEDQNTTTTVTLGGDYTSESMNMRMTADITDPSMPGGEGTMVMSIAGERIGTCDA